MILEGKLMLTAPIQKLWDSLLEPETLQACIPGAEKIEQVDNKTYDCQIKQKVGPISVRFKFTTFLTQMDAPTHMEMQGEGEDIGKAGRFSQKTSIDLRETEDGQVEISYRCDANIVGRLAMFGDRIMRAKAKTIEAEFTEALKARFENLG
jgi:carbon monoxide dehydrogenase subunit G